MFIKKLQSLIERYNINKKIIFIEHCKEMPLAYALVILLFQVQLNQRLLEE